MKYPKSLLREFIPFDKAADVERGMLKKHGTKETYGAGTFGVEFEIHVSPASTDEMDDLITDADPSAVIKIILRAGDKVAYRRDYSDWLDTQRENDNRYSRHGWDDSHGPMSDDDWLENNPEPSRSDFGDEEDFNSEYSKWDDQYDSAKSDFSHWQVSGMYDYEEEFVLSLLRSTDYRQTIYSYIEQNDLFSRLFPHANDSFEGNSDIMDRIRDWLIDNGEEVSRDGQGYENLWGVGVDGENTLEIRSKHLKETDFSLLVELMQWIRDEGFEVSGGTSAHVHVGLPEDFDYFDLLAMVTLVDEDKVKTDAGPDRKLNDWAKLRKDLTPHIIKKIKRLWLDEKDETTLSASQFYSMLKDTFKKFEGTNISSFFSIKTVEFRYFASTMVKKPQTFLKWVKYFMLLPVIAKRRNIIRLIDDGSSDLFKDGRSVLTAVRQGENKVTLSLKSPSGTNRPASQLRSTNTRGANLNMSGKEITIRRYLEKYEEKANRAGGFDKMNSKDREVLDRLRSAWNEILTSRGLGKEVWPKEPVES